MSMLLPSNVSSMSNSNVLVKIFSSEDGWQGMAFSTANLWLAHSALRFLAIGSDLNLLADKWKWPVQAWSQDHIRTGICL